MRVLRRSPIQTAQTVLLNAIILREPIYPALRHQQKLNSFN